MIVLFVVGSWVGALLNIAPAPAQAPPRPANAFVVVSATAYTCEPVAGNSMFPCGMTRWGADPATPGMACPVAWRGRRFHVPPFGVLTCDDTGAHDYIDRLPHIDIRLQTLGEAREWGVRTIEIESIGGGIAPPMEQP